MGPRRAPAAKKPKPSTPKDLCIYLAEAGDNGVVPEETIKLLRYCVIDKIFSENQDHIAICRTDMISTVHFDPSSWDTLRKVEKKFREERKKPKPKNDKDGKPDPDPIEALLEMCDYMSVQATEDSYEVKKVLFVAQLKSQPIMEDDLKNLGRTLKENKIEVSIVLPDKTDMDDQQIANCKLVRNVLEKSEDYGEFALIWTMSEARKQIFNTLNKPAKRSMPWNVFLEIGPDIKINVSGYVCTRKNTASNLKTAVLKEEKFIPSSQQVPGNDMQVALYDDEENASTTESKTVMVEIANRAVGKETIYKEKDGSAVDNIDVGKGYYFGDKLIPFNEMEKDEIYKSGEKCMKVLVFCPRSNIVPAFQQGDGTTLFYAKKGDRNAEVHLDALIRALHKHNRIAVVRKVYRKDTKVHLGILSPDLDRRCLVLSEVCFADDVSVPSFYNLFKKEQASESEEEADGITLSSKEQLIDELILNQSLDGFHPFHGPIDPAAANMRISIASRILDPTVEIKRIGATEDNIDLFFSSLTTAKNELMDKLKEEFPLQVIKELAERASGATIFRKRPLDDNSEAEPEKKIKLEVEEEVGGNLGAVEAIKEDVDYSDLLDEI